MKSLINHLRPAKIWPFAIIITGLLLSASITFATFAFNATRGVIIEQPIETEAILGEATASASLSPIPSSTPAPSVSKIMVSPSVKLSSTPIPFATIVSSPNPQTPTSIIVQIIATPTPLPSVASSPSSTPEPSPTPIISKVSIEVKQPDTTLNFVLEITENMNVCEAMQRSKDQGKINSLTISDKYLESFGTLLIEEMNGYKNNWVFTVNGESPMGCSLITLKNGDKIAWEFLNL